MVWDTVKRGALSVGSSLGIDSATESLEELKKKELKKGKKKGNIIGEEDEVYILSSGQSPDYTAKASLFEKQKNPNQSPVFYTSKADAKEAQGKTTAAMLGSGKGTPIIEKKTLEEVTAEGANTEAESKADWQGAMNTAMRFLSEQAKNRPKPPTPPGGSRGNVNFDAGSYYGALQANPFKGIGGGGR